MHQGKPQKVLRSVKWQKETISGAHSRSPQAAFLGIQAEQQSKCVVNIFVLWCLICLEFVWRVFRTSLAKTTVPPAYVLCRYADHHSEYSI